MTYWPKPEARQLPPEGHYEFRLNREPELKKFTYKDKQGNEKEGRRLRIYAIAIGEKGEFPIVDSFLPWEPRYTDLCAALKVEHSRDIQMADSIFKAEIKHEKDKMDPEKLYARIVNIVVPDQVADEDIPF
jgi:hypothetical protein